MTSKAIDIRYGNILKYKLIKDGYQTISSQINIESDMEDNQTISLETPSTVYESNLNSDIETTYNCPVIITLNDNITLPDGNVYECKNQQYIMANKGQKYEINKLTYIDGILDPQYTDVNEESTLKLYAETDYNQNTSLILTNNYNNDYSQIAYRQYIGDLIIPTHNLYTYDIISNNDYAFTNFGCVIDDSYNVTTPTGNNYILTDISIPSSTNHIKIVVKAKAKSVSTSQVLMNATGQIYIQYTKKFRAYLSGAIGGVTILENDNTYWFGTEFIDGYWKGYLLLDNDNVYTVDTLPDFSEWTEEWSLEDASHNLLFFNQPIKIFSQNSGEQNWLCETNLKDIKIWYDDNIWTPLKDGYGWVINGEKFTETRNYNNFTKVGDTISADQYTGIVKNFDDGNYLNSNITPQLPSKTPWKMQVKFKYVQISAIQAYLSGTTWENSPYIACDVDGKIACGISNGTSQLYMIKGTTVLNNGIIYTVEFSYNGNTSYTIKLLEENGKYNIETTYDTEDQVLFGSNLCVGRNNAGYCRDMIDLSDTFLEINNEKVWVPYNLEK